MRAARWTRLVALVVIGAVVSRPARAQDHAPGQALTVAGRPLDQGRGRRAPGDRRRMLDEAALRLKSDFPEAQERLRELGA